MGCLTKGFLISIFIFVLTAPAGAFGQEPEYADTENCELAVEKFLQTNAAFKSLSETCLKEAGIDPTVTIDDCPSVERDAFLLILAELENDHYQVCENCEGIWPKKDLGEGSCIRQY